MGRGNFLPIVAAVLFIIIAIGFILFKSQLGGSIQSVQTPTPTLNTADANMQILEQLPKWVTDAKWLPVERTTSDFREKQLFGVLRKGTLIRKDDYFFSFGDEEYLSNLGWRKGDLSADMPGGSAWNYLKQLDSTQQILIFSYQNRSLVPNPNGGVTSKCPCNYDLQVFLSDPF